MPTAKFEIKRKCKCCGNEFKAKSLDSYYCGRKCSDMAYKMKKAEERKRQQWDIIVSQIPDGREYISVAEAEAMFGVCAKTIRRLIRSGKIPSINLGVRLTRVDKNALMDVLPLREDYTEERPLKKKYSLEPEDCYTIGEIAKNYGVIEGTVYTHIRKYSIPTRQIGNYVYAPKNEIDNLYKDIIKP